MINLLTFFENKTFSKLFHVNDSGIFKSENLIQIVMQL